ncbi:hypothetical protein A0H81_08256 [Grifola frondosa]|uniref:Uncharacterized protein n=1 Tax=Grifola frondosa TaxID=5627 RepID=A0A1C7M5V0_GRIFR|nr:hypothetical protein A0H81_08256 [Grifola frondosa]
MSAALSSSSVVDASYVVNEKGKGKAKARDAGVDGFPFPPTFIPVHSRPRTSSGTTASALSLPSAVPLSSVPSTSTAVSTTSSRIRRSHQHSHSHTDKDRDPSKRKETNKAALVDQDKPRTFATARPRHHHNLSLTELFDASPLAWTTCSESFIPASSDPSRARSCMAVGVERTSSVTSGGRTRAETERTCVSSRENVTLETLHEKEGASHAGDIAQAHPPSSPVSDQPEDDDRDNDNDKGRVRKERPRPAKDREQAHKFIIDVDDRSVITGKAHLSMRERGLSTSHVGVVHDFGFAQDAGSQEREVEQIERDRLTALAYAHRERDREHARHAAEREKHLLKKRSKARGKSTLSASDDSDTLVDANFSTPVR